MNYELPDEPSDPQLSRSGPMSDVSRGSQSGTTRPSDDPERQSAHAVAREEVMREPDGKSPANDRIRNVSVVVRGEVVGDKDAKSSSKDSQTKDNKQPSSKKVSEFKVEMQTRLPALKDDADVGVQKSHVVTRDGKADLAFTGTLLASAAPPSAPQGKWQEYRVYETNGGKHVFSKVSRSVYADDQDAHEAEIFDPAPASMPSQLLRSARDLVHAKPLTWKNAAADFFGYDPLAKALYRKLGDEFEEHIT